MSSGISIPLSPPKTALLHLPPLHLPPPPTPNTVVVSTPQIFTVLGQTSPHTPRLVSPLRINGAQRPLQQAPNGAFAQAPQAVEGATSSHHLQDAYPIQQTFESFMQDLSRLQRYSPALTQVHLCVWVGVRLSLEEPMPFCCAPALCPQLEQGTSGTGASVCPRLRPQPGGGGDSAGPRTPTTPAPPPPPLGAFGQQLVAKGVAPRRPCAPKAPDAP